MLHVHRAARADTLVLALGDLLAVPPSDPFAADVVAVPTRGMERWLTQSLALRVGTSGAGRGDGVLANVRFPSPREVAADAVAEALGLDPSDDPWTRDRLLWPLIDVVDEHVEEPWLAILADHLKDSVGLGSGGRRRRLVAVRHLARLYDRYAVQRPAMLSRWALGQDVDGSGRGLPPHAAWQAELWRRARARISAPDPAARLTAASAVIRADPGVLTLPERFAFFGLTRLPAAHLDVLRAIASGRDVHLFLLHPSPALWSAVAAGGSIVPRRRADDGSARAVRSRLLASWGRDSRELQLVLGDPAGFADHPLDPPAAAPATLLERLQRDVGRNDAAPGAPLPGAGDARPPLDTADRSIEVHACHGRARQVEVLRDAILHVLRERPDLEPRDVIVMCPDIETFAPLIHATFGVGDAALGGDGSAAEADPDTPVPPDLRVRLADRAVRQTNPVLGAIGRLLELADARLTASELLDLADRAPVRRRFALDDDDLARLEDWVRRSGIRWGLDAAHRAPFRLTGVAAGTWHAGLDRVLAGVSMTEDDRRLLGGVLPLDDVESGAIDLAGRLAELVERVRTTVDRFAQARTVKGWAGELTRAADLLTAVGTRDAWQRASFDGLLAGLVADAAAGADDTLLDLAELRALLAERLAGRPTRANFRTGHLTFCTLSPMRSVPHAVVCLLGLDDAVFPRKAPHDGDDLLLADAHVGDQDGRAEDRQLLLDALLAAGDKLIVTYTGNDERTNAPRPPAVPVGELLDVIDRTVRSADGGPASVAVTVRHPLQPFDPRNFVPAAHAGGEPFSFDHVTLQGARALVAGRTERPPFLAAPLPPKDDRVVALDDVVRFVEHPARAFLRQRLGVGLGARDDALVDALPITLDPLASWAVGDRMLRARLAGQDQQAIRRAELARGDLPPNYLAAPVVGRLEPQVEAIAGAARQHLDRTTDLELCDVRVTLPDGRVLSGTVAGVDGDRVQHVVFSRLGPKHRLAAWVRLLALSAAHPERPFEAVTIGRAPSGFRPVGIARLRPLGADTATRARAATEQLVRLLDLVDRGLRSAPVLPCATAAAYAAAVHDGKEPVQAAGWKWTSGWGKDAFISREDEEPEHVRLFGGVLTLDELLAIAPEPDERGPGWEMDHGSRLGRCALRLWQPLLAIEELTTQ